MSWATELYAVYDKVSELESENEALLPISHSTAKAQLEVTIDKNGGLLNAKVIEDECDAVTMIPITEDSGTQSSGISPHPFADKLIYLAGDYCEHCNAKKGDEDKFSAYITQLLQWRDSEYTHPSVNALYGYLSKGTLIKDLIRLRVMTADENGKLTSDKIQKVAQNDCFVRFRVCGDFEERTWCDKTLREKFIEYNSSMQSEKALCYATGKQTFCTYKHPSKVLNASDKGKLFSANDESGYSYCGHFLNKEQTISIGYEFSQKMHNALKWLIARQGVSIGSLMLVVWNTELSSMPNVLSASSTIISECDEEIDDMGMDTDTNPDSLPPTFTSYKNALHKAIFHNAKFGESELDIARKAMILMLDEATTGRISVNMYCELSESEFYGNVNKWHLDTAWNRFDFAKKKDGVGSFSLLQIVDYAYGTEQSGKVVCKPEVKKDVIARLIPCVTNGRKLPSDIVRNLVNRASRRTAYS
ncbi:MAG: type I-C CRISPR-associated protein Cas8c/Csd1, partial [Oscillospiraceae bacterium]|nr:type I-C CRISPR-associated protein Cas8c/Csd1 [Oscillospiraceae bacterium]